MLRALAIYSLLVASASATGGDDFGLRLVRFDHAYQKFVQEFCGFKRPEDYRCDPAAGFIDAKEFSRARRAAADLFGFR